MARTENKSRRRKKYIVVTFFIILFFTTSIAGCRAFNRSGWNIAGLIADKHHYAENFIEFPLPEEASNIKIDIYNSLNPFFDWDYVKMRFELSPDAIPELLDLMCFDDEDLDSNRNPHFVTEYSPEWWTPDKATSFQAGECWGIEKGQTGYGKAYKILVDQSNPSSYVVYLDVHDLP